MEGGGSGPVGLIPRDPEVLHGEAPSVLEAPSVHRVQDIEQPELHAGIPFVVEEVGGEGRRGEVELLGERLNEELPFRTSLASQREEVS